MQMLGMHQEERQANTQTKKKKEVFINHFGSDFVHDGRVVGRHSSCCFCVFFFVYVCVWYALLSCVVAGACTSAGLFSPCSSSSRISWKHWCSCFCRSFFFWGGGTVDFTNLQSSKWLPEALMKASAQCFAFCWHTEEREEEEEKKKGRTNFPTQWSRCTSVELDFFFSWTLSLLILILLLFLFLSLLVSPPLYVCKVGRVTDTHTYIYTHT